MKNDIGISIRKYLEGALTPESLDEYISARLPKVHHKLGQSVRLPSGEVFKGMKFEHAELSKLHQDVIAKKISIDSALIVVDLITMNRDLLAEGGESFVDVIDCIGTPEDLKIWQEESC